MHNFFWTKSPDDPETPENPRFIFSFNSDMSGDVRISARYENYEDAGMDVGELFAINIPGQAILEFVARFVQREMVSTIENMPWDEVLGVPDNKEE